MANITISTGSIPEKYETIDTIFAIDSAEEGFFTSVPINKAFEGVKSKLISTCESLGGNAVIFCQFEYRVAVAQGLFGSKQAIEFFAYGTVVRKI